MNPNGVTFWGHRARVSKTLWIFIGVLYVSPIFLVLQGGFLNQFLHYTSDAEHGKARAIFEA